MHKGEKRYRGQIGRVVPRVILEGKKVEMLPLNDHDILTQRTRSLSDDVKLDENIASAVLLQGDVSSLSGRIIRK